MPRKIDADSQIGRRLKLRDLHLFFTVVESRSMAKAATLLGISQPAVSEVIADLEHSLGVRLFDRSPQGVEPTNYGFALLKRGRAAFDELKQGVRDIEFLADPTAGELTIGYPELMARVIVPLMIERFSRNIRASSCARTLCLRLASSSPDCATGHMMSSSRECRSRVPTITGWMT